jgi:hypothetical protein
VTFYTGTQSEVVFSSGFAYPTANASSSGAQNLVAGASGKYQQPVLFGGFFQQGRTNQALSADFAVILSGQGSATTAIITAGLATSPQSTTTASGSTLVAANAFTCTSFASATVMGRLIVSCFGAGYGTSSVSTNLWSSMSIGYQNAGSAGGTVLGGPANLATIDFSVNQWLYFTVTFSTASSSNSAIMQQLVASGLN